MCFFDPNLFPFTGRDLPFLLLLDQATAATMAAISTSVASSPSVILFRHPKEKPLTFRCSAQPRDGRKAPPLLQLVVGGVTELLKLLSPRIQRDEDGNAGNAPSLAHSVDDVVRILREDYDRAYFLTGDFTTDIYADDCLFEDPTISFRGRNQYSQNLDLLVPFFDCPSLKLEKIEKGRKVEMDFIITTWHLSDKSSSLYLTLHQTASRLKVTNVTCTLTVRTYLKLPWKPLIAIKGTTTYDLSKDFKIMRHAESWNVPALEAVGQIFKLGSAEVDG
ncbi:hypothetical protein ZIOFF_061101 [Zingiber officinale]|uniref:Uncharacterized protein n=1 Tax=Zingiber officinale TaxID=94328 RepID=A0A8J5FQG1_ZINOF|nr:hypothetical protein ZIOFF_061101 [Zingiber officinale]